MTPHEAADLVGATHARVEDYLRNADSVVDRGPVFAVRKGDVCHVAAKLTGLNGRAILRTCQEILDDWLAEEPILFAPVKHDNHKAVRLVKSLGFRQYMLTSTHVWFVRRK